MWQRRLDFTPPGTASITDVKINVTSQMTGGAWPPTVSLPLIGIKWNRAWGNDPYFANITLTKTPNCTVRWGPFPNGPADKPFPYNNAPGSSEFVVQVIVNDPGPPTAAYSPLLF